MDKKNLVVNMFEWIVSNVGWDILKAILLIIALPIATKWGDVFMLNQTLPKWLVYVAYFVFVYGALQVVTDIINFCSTNKLMRVVRARTAGVALRNEGESIASEYKAEKWVDKFKKWDTDTLLKISRLSKPKAEYWRVINRGTESKGILKGFNENQTIKLNVLEEKLKRLENILKEYDVC